MLRTVSSTTSHILYGNAAHNLHQSVHKLQHTAARHNLRANVAQARSKSTSNSTHKPPARTQTPRSNPAILRKGDATVYILGTMHISEASADATRTLIRAQKSKGTLDKIFLELDTTRYTRIVRASHAGTDEQFFMDALSSLLKDGMPSLAGAFQMAFKCLYRLLHNVGFASGVEFRAAHEEAVTYGVPVVLGDREATETMQRVATEARRDFSAARLLALLTRSAGASAKGAEGQVEESLRKAVESAMRGDMTDAQARLSTMLTREGVHDVVASMREYAPGVTRALLDERDAFMTEGLLDAVDKLPEGRRCIVAIVGLAHVDGMVREWERRVV